MSGIRKGHGTVPSPLRERVRVRGKD